MKQELLMTNEELIEENDRLKQEIQSLKDQQKETLREQLEKVIGKYYCEQHADTMYGAGRSKYFVPIKVIETNELKLLVLVSNLYENACNFDVYEYTSIDAFDSLYELDEESCLKAHSIHTESLLKIITNLLTNNK